MRVLIADDQRDVGKSLAELVRYCAHEVVAVVGSGFEAINAYSLHHPDLVLMDYRMPKLNGGTACRYILAKDPAARIILVSGWSPADGTDESGAISFLPKPVDLQRLNATLQSIAQTLPVSATEPAEVAPPASNSNYNEEWIDYAAPFVPQPECEPPTPSSDSPTSDFGFSSPSFDFPPPSGTSFDEPAGGSHDFPSPNFDLQSPNSDFPSPISGFPFPTVPFDTAVSQYYQMDETCPLSPVESLTESATPAEKKSRRPHGTARRAKRARRH